MIITSKYDATCRECGEAVFRGDRCNWVRGRKGVICLDCYHSETPPVEDSPQDDGWAMLIGRDRALQTFGPLTSEHQGELWRIITDWGYVAHQAPQSLSAPQVTPQVTPPAPQVTPPAPQVTPQTAPPAPQVTPQMAPPAPEDGMAKLMEMMRAGVKT